MAQNTDLPIDKPSQSPVKPLASHTAPAIDAPSIASATSDAIPDDPNQKVAATAGEKIHKWGTYLSVDWIFNAAAGVAFAYWGKYTKPGQKYFTKPLTAMFTTGLKPLIKNPESLEKSVEVGNTFVSIITGGLFTLPPLMALEENHVKRSISESLDTMIYGKNAVENDPRFKEAYEAIENAPKKDFISGMGSRYVALAPLLASVLIPYSRDKLTKHYFSHINSSTTSLCTKAGITAEKVFPKLHPEEAAKRFNFIHDNFAVDFGFGVPYAIMHSIFYNKFANQKDKDSKAAAQPEPAASQQPQPTEDKKWVAHVGEKQSPAAMPKYANFSERMAQTTHMEHHLA